MLAVIIPMYNEEANAERCVRAVCAVTSNLQNCKLFTVNDGSKDRTVEVLTRLRDEGLPFSLVTYPGNRGFGGALVEGVQAAHAAGFTYGLFMDSDLTNDPALIPQFQARLSDGKLDFIKASRYVPGGGMKGVPFYRQIFTIVGNRIAYFLFNMGIHDCTNGFHAVRLELLVNEQFNERGFSFLLEELLLLKKKGARGAEIPYTLTARQSADGKSKFHYTFKLIWSYLKYALRAVFVAPQNKAI